MGHDLHDSFKDHVLDTGFCGLVTFCGKDSRYNFDDSTSYTFKAAEIYRHNTSKNDLASKISRILYKVADSIHS